MFGPRRSNSGYRLASEVVADADHEGVAAWLGAANVLGLLRAKEFLDARSDEASTLLPLLLQDDVTTYRRQNQTLAGVLLVPVCLAGLAGWSGALNTGNLWFVIVVGALWVALAAVLARYGERGIVRTRMRNVTLLLEDYGLPNAAGALLEALHSGDGTTAATAVRALTVTLPRMSRDDCLRLTRRQRRHLRRMLRGWRADVIIGVLHAEQCLRDREAIPLVRRIARCPAWVTQCDAMRRAAEQCLSVLE
jgi:hypothetical protein